MRFHRLIRLTALLLLLVITLGGCFGNDAATQPISTGNAYTGETSFTQGNLNTEPEAQQTTAPVSTQPQQSGQVTTTTPLYTTTPDTEAAATTTPDTESTATTVPVTEAPVTTVPTTQPPATEPSNSGNYGFKVYFIDVGQADAALVVCDGKTMLIDGGNSADSNLIYAFLKNRNINHLDYIVATHPHEDHVGGLSGALNYATIGTALSSTTAYSSNAFTNFATNVKKQGKTITIPYVNQRFYLGSAQCTVLAVNTSSDANNQSIVLRIVYGSTSFLFTADAEREVEQVLLNKGVNLRSTVLKVGHHGSSTSTSYAFLRAVAPQYAVISCGKGNSYGHPHDEVLSRLHDAQVYTFRTDLQGDIVCTSNGSSVSFSVNRNWNANVFGSLGGNTQPTTPATTAATTMPVTTTAATEPALSEPAGTSPATEPPVTEAIWIEYVLNTNSMKFHYATCSYALKISDKNIGYFTGDRDDLLAQGYSPCGVCKP